jgi:hypothetical protein
MSGNQITNVGNVDGVDISAHASRHLPNGLDALTTGAASSVSRLTSNTEGIANSFARQDHTHNVIEEVATIIPTVLGTTTLTTSSSNRIIFTGSVFGTVLNLGNATTYSLGKTNNLYNNSTQTISIVNNASTEIFRLEPYCKLEVILQDNTIANGVWLSLTHPDFDKLILVLDDFISGTAQGQTVFTSSAAGGGTGVVQVTSLFGRQGVNSITTGNSATGRTCLNKGGNIILFDNGVVVTEMSIRFEDLSTAGERYTFHAGFGDNIAAGDMLDGVYFEYAEGISGNFWRLKTANNGTRTTTVTTSPIAADTWYKLKIEVAPGGTRADFFIDNVNIGNITTNIPTGTGRTTGHLLKIEKSAGSTARLAYTDYINFKAYNTMIKYEIRDGSTVIQFATLVEAQGYNPDAEVFEVMENNTIVIEPSIQNWYDLEQSLYSSTLFSKGFGSQGNGFALLLKILSDGSTKGAHQSSLLAAIRYTIMGITGFTQADTDALNNHLQTHNFTIRI